MPEITPRLAAAVRRWCDERALTQQVIASRGGPSTSSMTKITAGAGAVQGVMLSRLDMGLGWGEGMSAQILAGGPTPWESTPQAFDWRQVGNSELLAEVARRMEQEEGGQEDAGQAEDQKTITRVQVTPAARADVTPLKDLEFDGPDEGA